MIMLEVDMLDMLDMVGMVVMVDMLQHVNVVNPHSFALFDPPARVPRIDHVDIPSKSKCPGLTHIHKN